MVSENTPPRNRWPMYMENTDGMQDHVHPKSTKNTTPQNQVQPVFPENPALCMQLQDVQYNSWSLLALIPCLVLLMRFKFWIVYWFPGTVHGTLWCTSCLWCNKRTGCLLGKENPGLSPPGTSPGMRQDSPTQWMRGRLGTCSKVGWPAAILEPLCLNEPELLNWQLMNC